MTIDEVVNYYRTTYRFYKQTGMSWKSLSNWKKKGFVPLESQRKLEKLSGGALRASLEHGRPKEGED